jgi:hypothetical protein
MFETLLYGLFCPAYAYPTGWPARCIFYMSKFSGQFINQGRRFIFTHGVVF